MTYEQIKEKYYNDEISLLPAKKKATLEKILNDWFGGTSFDESRHPNRLRWLIDYRFDAASCLSYNTVRFVYSLGLVTSSV